MASNTYEYMAILEVIFFLFLSSVTCATEDCPTSKCPNSTFEIRFPFRLKGRQPQTCGYPGFDLRCNSQGIAILNLPNSGDFYIRNISYFTQELQLYDPYNCLPRRRLAFNLSDSPFVSPYYQNYTFLVCPSEFTFSRFTSIDCLSNSTNTTFATSSMTLATSMTMCNIIVTLPIPKSWPLQSEDGFSSKLDNDLQLVWDVPNCEGCEEQGGMCGFKNTDRQEVTCFYNQGKGSTKGLKVFVIIALSLAFPAVVTSFGLYAYICYGCCHYGIPPRRETNTVQQQSIALNAEVTTGLEESTIESYTKVILGESGRLPGPYGSTCPICLAEYRPKETLRCIPECNHCFHADCVDEWLRMKSTCPVCRNSPFPAHVSLQNV